MQASNKFYSNISNQENFNSQLVQNFVGRNYRYFNKKWNILKDKKNFISINWIALFFGPIWFAYRKMYLYLISFYGSIIIIDILLSELFKIQLPSSIYTVVCIVIGFYSNGLYLYFVRKKIKKIKAMEKDEKLLNERIKKEGGISIISSIITALIILSGIVILIIDLIINGNMQL